MAAKITAPRKGDIANLRWLLGRIHVSTPDAEVEADIRRRLEGKVFARGEITIRSWVRAALAIHHANQRTYSYVASGR